ncbi:MAG: LysR family hydrogen peroxide-inducible transcriptional activator [Yoonia sp.]|jgi:LysR family hydrogen peroxide-inducible transcriptional activator
MADFTLKHLRYFEAVAREAHFRRAADRCSISQPALSMQVKELEQILGAALFERNPRAVSLTQFGQAFAPRAREILQATDDLSDLARASQDQLIGRLRLGVIPTVAPYMLPRIIHQLGQSHPGLDLQIRESMTPRLVQELKDGRLDAAILALPATEPTLTEAPLFTEDFVLVRPMRDADEPIPSSDKLGDMQLLLLEEGHCFRDQALAFCNIQAARPWDGFDGSSLSTLVQMVGACMGVTLLPEMAVNVETRSANVAVARFADHTPTRVIGMVWRKSNPLGRQLSKVASALKPPHGAERNSTK